MASETRIRKISDLIQRVLSEALHREISDPRLSMVTISAVEVTRDLAYAKVFVSTLGAESHIPDVLQGFEKAKGFLRNILARQCQLRVVPQLQFFHDNAALNSQKISMLISAARAKDEADIKPDASDDSNA